ncbi:MAG: PfkB family carbohydrate kinase, partial [Dehalococcoidia bacterium]
MINQNGKSSEKIKKVEELGTLLGSVRAAGKKVVHCHGVFDLLHIGHVRHFEQAKQLGDVLVATVTPDRYVNKGPDRPAFNEGLRAEAIAALECVDYVAINQWPLAVEAIKTLSPDFYVKGQDYQDAADDRTGGITLEEAAVKSVGGQLAFTNDIAFSSSQVINQHLPAFPQEVRDYLAGFATRYSADDVVRYLDCVRPLKTLVVGEAIIDEYQYCEAIGKSSKEPMLAVKLLSVERFAGGILAVGNHLADFCDNASLITLLGADNSHEEFIREQVNSKIHSTFLYQKDSPTIVKRRFVDKYFFTKLLEVYEINSGSLDEGDNRRMCAALTDQVHQYDVVIVVDYGHGILSREAIEILCGQARFLAVNAQSNAGNLGYHTISRYPRADYMCMAENEIRLEARDRQGDLRGMILALSQKLSCGRIVVTRGDQGCLCYSDEEG